jgi:hypothetical protein
MSLLDRARENLEGFMGGEKQKYSSPADQTGKEREKVQFVDGKFNDIRSSNARVAHEGIWLTNVAYLLGFDGIYYDTATKQFRPLNAQSHFLRKNRVYNNEILPTANNRLARLTKSPPKYDVRPKSSDQEDKDAANLGLEVIMDVWNRTRMDARRRELIQWTQQCGHSYLKVRFNPEKGKTIDYVDEFGEPQTMQEGEIEMDVVSAFEVFPDPMAKNLDEAKYVIQAKVRSLDYFKETYPEKGHLVKAESVDLSSLQYEGRIQAMNNNIGAAGGSDYQPKNSAIEKSYYEKPTKKYPKGRQIIMANGVLLLEKELPIDEIPFVKFDDVVIAGKYYSEAIITQMRPVQDQLNRNLDLRSKWTNRLLTGKYIAARGHGLISEAINDESGEIVEYDPVPGAAEPHAMQIPQMPSYIYNEDESLKGGINNISGINEVSRGQLPSASIPALGMQFLVEQDDTRIGVVTEGHEQSYADMGRLILKFAEKYYKTERFLKVTGKNKEYQVKTFRGEDIKSNFDVYVVRGSTLPGSKVLGRQEIINAWQSGLLGDPNDPAVREKVLGMMEFGDIGEAWKDRALDMSQIKRHIKMIEDEMQPPVHEMDNHTLFVQKLNEYRKSDKFDNLSPISQEILYKTIEMHVQAQVDLVAPGVGDDPMNPDLQFSTAAQETAADMGLNSMGPIPEEDLVGEGVMDEPIEGEGVL